MSKHFTILGIDGSGKSSLIHRLMASTQCDQSKITLINAPNYHETSDSPFNALSRQLELFSSLGDELKSYELKGLSLYLQATLFGVIEQFVIDNNRSALILSQRHPVLDSLVYGELYVQYMKEPVISSALQKHVVTQLQTHQASWDIILQWFELHKLRIKSQSSIWNFSQELLRLFQLNWRELIDELQFRYQTQMPDGIIYIHPEIEQILHKVEQRAQESQTNKELHEHLEGLSQLEKNYQKMIIFIQCTAPHIPIFEVAAYDNTQMDQIIQSLGTYL